MNYKKLATQWSKALAYVRCGKLEAAGTWAQALVDELRNMGVVIR